MKFPSPIPAVVPPAPNVRAESQAVPTEQAEKAQPNDPILEQPVTVPEISDVSTAELARVLNEAHRTIDQLRNDLELAINELRSAKESTALAHRSALLFKIETATAVSDFENKIKQLEREIALFAIANKLGDGKKTMPNEPPARKSRGAGTDGQKKKTIQKDKARPNRNKKRPQDTRKRHDTANAEEQIKKLKESMDRQIKKTSEKIRKAHFAKIELLKNSDESNAKKEIRNARSKMRTELKENEDKIRTRIESRIKRIRDDS